MQYRILRAFAATLVIVIAAACGGSDTPTEVAESAAPAVPAFDPATAGNVIGTITLEGTPPAAEQIRMSSDPVCVAESTSSETEYFVVSDTGGLGNVFVYVKEGLEGQNFPAATGAIELQQDGCQYTPHVFGIRVGQTLSIVNSDPTLHNIHATPANNEEFNTGQPIEGMVFERMFDTSEVMVPFQCDVHGWMNAYVGVIDHPYFGVTGVDGSFDISNLPPGDYVVEAWHEELGTQTQNLTVNEGATTELNFTFAAG